MQSDTRRGPMKNVTKNLKDHKSSFILKSKTRPARRLSPQLSAYFRSYAKKEGSEDSHVRIFRALKGKTKARTVLYPGCHRHITPSFFFPNVHYVDSDSKVSNLYTDPKTLTFVKDHKEYPEDPDIKFSCKDFTSKIAKPKSVDLLISLSAGIISKPCGQYVKPGGYLFVNDSHSDARTVYLDSRFKLVSVYDESRDFFDDDPDALTKYFHTKDGKEITRKMILEGIKNPRAKRLLQLTAEKGFYLFQRTKCHRPI